MASDSGISDDQIKAFMRQLEHDRKKEYAVSIDETVDPGMRRYCAYKAKGLEAAIKIAEFNFGIKLGECY